MRKLLILLLSFWLTTALDAQEITVAAAADLNYAMKDVAAHFQQQTGNEVNLSLGASGNLYSEIRNGAPYDLFFSADSDYPKKLAASGLIDSSSLRTYAVGHLVLWHPSIGGNHDYLPATRDEISKFLLRPDVKRIAIANPEHAPYGRAAMATLQHYNLKGKVADKLVFGENVSQAAQFVQSGNAQVGFIPLSLILYPSSKNAHDYWSVPQDAYPPLEQVAGIVSSSKHKKTAQAFLDYVRSAQGAAIMEQYGFSMLAQK